MCELYSGTEAALFEIKTRSIRLDGHVTSIRLEAVFWQILNQIAEEANLKLSTFLTRVYHERLDATGDISNFSSLLRVACTTYLNNQQRIALKSALTEAM
ncbi:ribbon-helix-helix domain-containing protein [Neptunomonas antarctica]|uniref:Predicted DNA-binding protein, contains Ribbon-helix-helix (RHH) domain n=1 Tax=Neptunomonas antarctica TaxID=619304 RepID=A0A1N7M4R1_9GAMM|nr:ribbon-helix-helix domain-containing protein [Neptunomonas antarctica]SIS81106.1 Predicted DNA-binding protein, contains Ribbon-helix-helix (RHH) domain [Neptunomonas antarctica]